MRLFQNIKVQKLTVIDNILMTTKYIKILEKNLFLFQLRNSNKRIMSWKKLTVEKKSRKRDSSFWLPILILLTLLTLYLTLYSNRRITTINLNIRNIIS